MPQPTKKNNPPLAEQGVNKMLYIFLQVVLRIAQKISDRLNDQEIDLIADISSTHLVAVTGCLAYLIVSI